MLENNFAQQLSEDYSFKIYKSSSLAGGNINSVYKLNTANGDLVLKLNGALNVPKMFEKEAKGLEEIRQTASFKIPNVVGYGLLESTAYLLLEYIQPKKPCSLSWQNFAENLAKLHNHSASEFGLSHDNYIGSLQQPNTYCNTAKEFFITQRLEPQFKLASQNGYKFKKIKTLYKVASNLIPDESPSLIHGDLWSGNNFFNSNDQAVLIDPAISYSIREMDLAMMQLFGGYPNLVFSLYHELYKLPDGWQERIKLFQLYYILVHVNLFGRSYVQQAQSILKLYT